MNHLTEDDFIARLYADDHDLAVETVIDPHLNACAQCTRDLAALRKDMDEINFAKPPERDASFGYQVWASISGSLTTYRAPKQRWFSNRPFLIMSYAAACIVLLLCAFVGGRHWERRQSESTAAKTVPQKPPHAINPPQRVIVVVLSDHLDRSERLLVELKHADADYAGMASPLTDEARSLLTANRICRQKAKHDDDPALEKALDHLDHLFAQIANREEPLNNKTITRLQKEVNADGLLFEVRVLRSRQAPSSAETKGTTI